MLAYIAGPYIAGVKVLDLEVLSVCSAVAIGSCYGHGRVECCGGVPAGYIFGGLVGAAMGWRAAFLLEGLMMVPFVAFAFISKPLHLTGSREHEPGKPRVHHGLGKPWQASADAFLVVCWSGPGLLPKEALPKAG
jgi:hypothetical protein